MSQQPHNLVRMGNQIAEFFASYPDEQEAVQEVALHLKKFWAPSMRQALWGYLQADSGAAQAHSLLHQAVQSQPGWFA